MSFGALIGTGIVAFAGTNIDDFFVLVVFFARAKSEEEEEEEEEETAGTNAIANVNDRFLTRQVVIGQVTGFSIICFISLLGLVLGAFLPVGYVGLIGFIPLLMGVRGVILLILEYPSQCWKYNVNRITNKLFKKRLIVGSDGNHADDHYDQNIDLIQSHSSASHLEIPKEKDEKDNDNANDNVITNANDNDHNEDDDSNTILARMTRKLLICFHPHIVEVAAITVANGGDNVSIYLPLFAVASLGNIAVYLIIFYIMLGIWIFSSYSMLRCSYIAKFLSKQGKYIVPFVYIGLGIYVTSSSWSTMANWA